jgi:hypothetical protein
MKTKFETVIGLYKGIIEDKATTDDILNDEHLIEISQFIRNEIDSLSCPFAEDDNTLISCKGYARMLQRMEAFSLNCTDTTANHPLSPPLILGWDFN